MQSSNFVLVSLLTVLLLYRGCKGEDQPALHSAPEVSKDSLLLGTWIVDSLNITSVSVPSFCNKIGKGATFEFTINDTLRIYPKDSMQPCDTYSYKFQNSFIHFVKDDMIMLVEYERSTEGKLALKSNTFFRWQEDEALDSSTYQYLLEEGVTAFLSKEL